MVNTAFTSTRYMRRCVVALFSLIAFNAVALQATPTYQATVQGDFTLAGSCMTTALSGGTIIDEDSDTTTASSSSARLTGIPAGATITKALLVWHTRIDLSCG